MESNRVEYKRELSDSLEKEAVAFLNYHDGGIIYIGIDNSQRIVGVSNADEIQLKIKDRLKNNIHPSCLGLFDVIHEKKDEKDIIKITFASGPEKPYYIKKYGMSEKGCFMRIGSSAEPMPSKIIEDSFARRIRNSIGIIRSPRQDLTFEQLKIFYNETGFEIGEKFTANLELLTEEGAFNYGAYLLADNNGNSVQVAKYAGQDRVDLLESKEYGYCCLVKTCKQVLDRLEGVENRTFTKITSKERINRTLWNKVALREAIINAIIHNDYISGCVPKFEIFEDRLEITSAGNVQPGEEQENFFAGFSNPRNKILMRIFKDLDIVEYLGSGMPRILKAYPRESYQFFSHFIRLVFPISKEALELAKEVMTDAGQDDEHKSSRKTPVKTPVKTLVKTLVKTPEIIIQKLKENPKITLAEVALAINKSLSAVERASSKLVKEGKLKYVGPKKGGHWEVTEKVNV